MDETKIRKVYEALLEGKKLDDERAYKLCKTHRFSSIIFELRHRYELNIQDRWVTNENTGTRYKEYWLVK